MRQTSIDATTCRQALKGMAKEGKSITSFSSYTSRFSELRDSGFLREEGKRVDPDTGHEAIVWAVTDDIPDKFEKPKKHKCEFCDGKGYY